MEFLTTLNNASYFNIIILCLGCFLLCSVFFGVHLNSNNDLAYPVLLNSFNSFSTFFLVVAVYLFCFDFFFFDSLYFYNQNFQLFFLSVSIFCLLITKDFLLPNRILKYEYDSLFLFVIFSSVCLCFVDDFLIFYLTLELQSLAFYVFAAFNRASEFTSEAGLKYFIFGSIISCFLLLGFSFLYLSFGSLTFEVLFSVALVKNDIFNFLGVIFILIALLFKLGAAPFHSWLCDVYDGSVLSVTFLFAALPKIIIFSIVAKLCFSILINFYSVWSVFFLFASLASIAVGSLSAIYQKRIKRLFAYSTISHTGFILLGVLVGSLDSSKALFFYILAYAILTIFLFSVLIYSSISNNGFSIKYIINWTSVGLNNYFFAFCFTMILFSIAGIPPLLGFFSKFFVVLSAVGHEFYITSIIVILLSGIGCFYYIRFIKIFFFTKNTKYFFLISNSVKQNSELVISFFLLVNLCFFIRPELLSNFATILSFSFF